MDAKRLRGLRGIVTGAGSGIGRAVALAYAREGADLVVVVDRDGARVEEVVSAVADAGTQALGVVVDLDKSADVDRLCEVIDDVRPTNLVSNAAAWSDTPFLDTDIGDLDRILRVNVVAPYRISQVVARVMVDHDIRGSIAFTGSISALGANRGFSGYCTSKGAIVSMARSMAVELAEHGIRVNIVSPGTVDTAMPLEHVGRAALERMRESMPGVPMGRLGQPEEIAEVFVFLASQQASYVSGHNLVVDGALTAQVYDAPK